MTKEEASPAIKRGKSPLLHGVFSGAISLHERLML